MMSKPPTSVFADLSIPPDDFTTVTSEAHAKRITEIARTFSKVGADGESCRFPDFHTRSDWIVLPFGVETCELGGVRINFPDNLILRLPEHEEDADSNFLNVLELLWKSPKGERSELAFACTRGRELGNGAIIEFDIKDRKTGEVTGKGKNPRFYAADSANGVSNLYYRALFISDVVIFGESGHWAIIGDTDYYSVLAGTPEIVEPIAEALGGWPAVLRRLAFSTLVTLEDESQYKRFAYVLKLASEVYDSLNTPWPFQPIVDNPNAYKEDRKQKIYPYKDRDPENDYHVYVDHNPPRKVIKFRADLDYLQPCDYEWQALRSWV